MMVRGLAVTLGLLAAGGGAAAAWHLAAEKGAPAVTITVYKTPTCGCCGKWVEHLKQAGFEVRSVDLDDLTEIEQASGVPIRLRTCHTAVVEGYVVEGHVPADVIERLLKERPAAAGIAVPGMPIGSPGMEGSPKQSYDVLLFRKDGSTTVFAKR